MAQVLAALLSLAAGLLGVAGVTLLILLNAML